MVIVIGQYVSNYEIYESADSPLVSTHFCVYEAS